MLENTQNPEVHPASEPQPTNAWVEEWARHLLVDGAEAKLSKDLVKRWKQNSPTRMPKGLRSPISDDIDWSILLERFLLSAQESPKGANNARECAKVLVSSFESAMTEWPGGLGSIVWFRDVAALRRVAYGDDRTRQDAARLIVNTLGKLAGASVEPKKAHYMYLEKLYAVASNCMVSELYEKEVVRHQYMAGLTGGNFSDFTVMWILEKARLQEMAPAREEDETCSPVDLAKKWLDLGKRFQTTIDGLFDTLLSISAQAEERKKARAKVDAFVSMLEAFFSDNSHRPNDWAKYWGFQRVLDLHWIRIGAMVSPERWSLSICMRNFVQEVSKNQDNILGKIQRCRLSVPSKSLQAKYGELPGTLDQKNDPYGVSVRVKVDGDGNSALTADLPEGVEAELDEWEITAQAQGAQM